MSDQMIGLPLRVVAFCWGLLEFVGFLFTAGNTMTLGFIVYAALPPVALIVCAAVPDKWATNSLLKSALMLLLVVAVIRRIHSIVQEVTDTPPYLLAAGMQLITLTLLVLLVIRVMKQHSARISA